MRPTGFYRETTAWCPSCAVKAPTGDWSDSVPIYSWSEMDRPEHCHRCEALIVHALTGDGLEYVHREVADHVLLGHGRACIVAAWWERWAGALRREYVPEQYAALCERFNAAPAKDSLSPVLAG